MNNDIFIKSRVKIPSLVRVIKKKENYWDVYPPSKSRYYSNIIEEKHYIYSFLNENSTNNCLDFLHKFKKVNGEYPGLITNNKLKLLKKIADEEYDIQYDYETFVSMKERCLTNGIGLIGVVNFNYTFIDSFFGSKNVFNLHISAVDLLENEQPNYQRQIKNLNYLL